MYCSFTWLTGFGQSICLFVCLDIRQTMFIQWTWQPIVHAYREVGHVSSFHAISCPAIIKSVGTEMRRRMLCSRQFFFTAGIIYFPLFGPKSTPVEWVIVGEHYEECRGHVCSSSGLQWSETHSDRDPPILAAVKEETRQHFRLY